MNVGVVDFAKEMNTDKTGKFRCVIPLKYIYQPKYILTITATIAGKPVKQSFTKLCIPGESKREFEQKLDNGYTLKLDVENISRKER
jgi:hypothetical protein